MVLLRSFVAECLAFVAVIGAATIASAAPIDVQIHLPKANVPLRYPNDVNGQLRVSATVRSDFEIVRVTARIGVAQFDLHYSDCAFLGICQPGWTVALPIEDFQLVLGPNLLEVEAEDAFGSLGSTSVTLNYVPPPVLDVIEPADDEVATPLIAVRADCQDLVPQPCSSVSVRVSGGPTLLDVAGGIDADVDLSAYDGQKVALEIVGVGASGTPGVVTRNIYVEASPLLEEVERVPGVIQRANENSVVYRPPGDVFRQRERSSGIDTDVLALSDPSFGGSTSLTGIVLAGPTTLFLLWTFPASSSRCGANGCLYEYYADVLEHRGASNSMAGSISKGPFAVWASGSELRRIDGVTGDEVLVTSSAAGSLNIASNGDIVAGTLADPLQISRYRNGFAKPLFRLPSNSAYVLEYDGINVVYQKTTNSPDRELWIHTAAGAEEMIAPAGHFASSTQVANAGWVAFTRKANDATYQVWRRELDGSLTKLTFFGSDTQVASVGPNGEIAFTHAGRRCYIEAGGAPVQECDYIGSSRGTSFYLGDELHMHVGGSLFRVDVPEPAAWMLQFAGMGVLALLARKRHASVE